MMPRCRENLTATHTGASDHGLVLLRNPWIEPQTYPVKLAIDPQRTSKAATFSAVSIYPEARVYGRNLKPGENPDVPVAPYETIVLVFR